jgi:hypothetical protein
MIIFLLIEGPVRRPIWIVLTYFAAIASRLCTALPRLEPLQSFSRDASRSDQRFAVLTDTYTYIGAAQQFVVPAGATSMTVTLYGASGTSFSRVQGDGTTASGAGGNGGVIRSTIPVAAGQTYYLYVGGAGNGQSGGYNGGGSTSGTVYGMGGGGATDLRMSPFGLTDRIMVAGGGGGASGNCGIPTGGGDAGYPAGFTAPICSSNIGGDGGTSSGGGTATDMYCTAENVGTLGTGGPGCPIAG